MDYAAYLDESFDSEKDGVYAVAAVVGTGWRILSAESKWQALLTKHRLRSFKSSKLRNRPQVVAEFATVMRDCGLVGFGVVSNTSEVREQLRGSALHRQYSESPYMLLYQHCFVSLAIKFARHGARDPISFVCDENARYLGILQRSYPELKQLNPTAATLMGSCSTAKDDACLPLQMADLIAGELRKKARSWESEDADYSDALRLLLDTETICSVQHFDVTSLRKVRSLVDDRVSPAGGKHP